MSFQQYNVYDGLTAVRVVDTANLAGVYFNGQVNNGVGGTLTVTATGVLTIDSVAVNSGDRVLLVAQTLANQNGIYLVSNPGATGIQPILTRAADQQNIEQIRAGQFVSVAAGTVNNATIWTVVEPLPATFGINNLVWADASGTSGTFGTAAYKAASNNADPTLASVTGAYVVGDLMKAADTVGSLADSGITSASVQALIAAGGGGALGVHSATFSGSGATASTVITDAAISASSVVIARFISSANVVTVQTVLPAAGQVTVTTDTAPSTSVIEYISFTPSAALLTAGVVVGKGSYGGGSATFVIADANITAGMVVNANFQSQVTPSKIYTALAGAGTITFVCSANPGVCVMEYAAMLPGDISSLGLHAENYSNAGGFASIAITDASITASSIVTAEFESQANVALIQKVTPSAGTLTVLASIDPGISVVSYMATASAQGGPPLQAANNLSDVASASASLANLGGLPLAGGQMTGQLLLDRGTATSTAGAATVNHQAGVITTEALTTAAAAAYAFTLTDSRILTTSVVVLTLMGGTNTTRGLELRAIPAAGSAAISIFNNNVAGTALNGTLIFGFEII